MSIERGARGACGFTLIETLVVTAICAGLVALMTVLYKSVATSAQALSSGKQEWLVQRQVREQLQHLLVVPKSPLKALSGTSKELYFCSWQSRAQALNGMPAMVYFRYDESARVLYYHELALPAWWPERAAASLSAERLQEAVRASRGIKLMTAVEDLRFLFLAEGADDPRLERWRADWREDKAPRLIQMNFTKAGRTYSIWFDTLAIEA
jgi:prepilin-type N-terminal cleavage/methylation domain-containing protein